MFDHVRIVLVETSHPGNIGATARAMKNMGLSQLVMVKPQEYPSGKATAMAASADNILAEAKIVDTLEEAIVGCTVVIGSSARPRSHDCITLSPSEAGVRVSGEFAKQQIAIVFGRERTGLTNEELQHCQYRLHIPANPDYSSLNVAQSVQVICYELRMAALGHKEPETERELVPVEDMEQFYKHLEATLIDLEFLDPTNPGQLMLKLRRIFNRAQLEPKEHNLLRGVWSAAQGKKIEYLKNVR
ncbi:MAG: RNA methyltransferase [Methylococcales bacterium]|jgi:tRNA (cytidine32/uridine32-2'-O)-methyltransferase|nr:RNA methyltransferase [Methylococcales bacterium]